MSESAWAGVMAATINQHINQHVEKVLTSTVAAGDRVVRPKYRGVFWHPRKNRYVAKIKHHCRTCNLGAYEDPRVAARVYDYAAKVLKGPDAEFNFPPGDPPPQVPGVIIRNTLRQIGVLRE